MPIEIDFARDIRGFPHATIFPHLTAHATYRFISRRDDFDFDYFRA
jgi:hypothetical protein